MENNDKLKEIDIKSRTCYYFNNMIKTEDFDFINTLIDKKSYENILVYSISYKILIDSEPLHIIFDKIDGFIRVYNGTCYLVLFRSEKYYSIYERIKYFNSHNYAAIKVDSYDFLPLGKTMIFCNFTILVNPA